MARIGRGLGRYWHLLAGSLLPALVVLFMVTYAFGNPVPGVHCRYKIYAADPGGASCECFRFGNIFCTPCDPNVGCPKILVFIDAACPTVTFSASNTDFVGNGNGACQPDSPGLCSCWFFPF